MTKIALITGAGSGIGQACALALADAGWSLTLCGRRLQRLEGTCETARAKGAEAIAIEADVGDADAVARLFAEVEARFGRLDLLFNNAGTGAPPKPLEDLTLDEWRRVVDTNLTGAFLCTQAAVRAERLVRIQDALNALEPIDREVLALRHFEQLSPAETAAALDLKPDAASKRYIRALKRLKQALAEMPGGLEAL